MRLTVLGCSGSYPAADCACSGYLIEHEGTAVAVDLGPGALGALQRHLDLAHLSGVVLTHSHADHWVDLTGLHVAAKYGLDRTGLPVWGTAENRQLALALMADLEPTVEWTITGDDDDFAIGGLRFTLARTDHYVQTHAVRVDAADGTSIVYSSDTGPDWSIEHLGRGVDLALVESTYVDEESAAGIKHLWASLAGEHARAAGAQRCVLTHFWPGTAAADHQRAGSTGFGGPVLVASPHSTFEL
ncbi:MAG: MBL fold metallo-hydrolase [Acidimicrobiia bacterium]|nr:MBL fold metallo-hydrolase [Acidimicrobiia bacterium]